MIKGDIPVLFVHIGWATRYDGTEPIGGNFRYLKSGRGHRLENWEAEAFVKTDDGYFRCGIGPGELGCKTLNIVFVARDYTKAMRIVGIYRNAQPESTKHYTKSNAQYFWAKTRRATLLPVGIRPVLRNWPVGSGIRRWASRGDDAAGTNYPGLLNQFSRLTYKAKDAAAGAKFINGEDEELELIEGAARKRLVQHRNRERKLREAKIRATLKQTGRLRCEVRNCGFDFQKTYGILGAGYAQVHHCKPLAYRPRRGAKTGLSELKIVCANCHAMIHKGGECRSIRTLIANES